MIAPAIIMQVKKTKKKKKVIHKGLIVQQVDNSEGPLVAPAVVVDKDEVGLGCWGESHIKGEQVEFSDEEQLIAPAVITKEDEN